MCDCYSAKCEGCGCNMSIHIADFCTPREKVHPYCPRCTRKFKGKYPKGKVFEDEVTYPREVEGSKRGQKVVIICDDKKAYGIALN